MLRQLYVLDHLRRTPCKGSEMINLWGVCEFGEITHDPLRRWEMCCNSFSPKYAKRVKTVDKCCANCVYWLIADENIEGSKIK